MVIGSFRSTCAQCADDPLTLLRNVNVSWIKPGISAWDAWWTGENPHLPQYREVWSRGDTASHREYIDFAAENGNAEIVAMLLEANVGFLIHAPENVKREFPQFTAVESHAELLKLIKASIA